MVTLPSIRDFHCPLNMMGTCALKKSRLEYPFAFERRYRAFFCAQAHVVFWACTRPGAAAKWQLTLTQKARDVLGAVRGCFYTHHSAIAGGDQ